MSKIDILNSNLKNLENNINIYKQEIEDITKKVNDIITSLTDSSALWNSQSIDTIESYSLSDFSDLEKNLLDVTLVNDAGDKIIDYSVTSKNLTLKETININGKQVNLYDSDKTNAVYVISNGLTAKERKQLEVELKNHLSNDQMAILTFNGDYYHYDVLNRNRCTDDYAVVGKTNKGKMYSFETTDKSEIVVDNGTDNDTLITTVNGMIIANKMVMKMETGTEINLRVRPKINIRGGQTVTEFERLSFSGGVHESVGSEYATVYMEGDWQSYANTKQNKANGTWINENNNRNVVTVGAGPQRNYPKKYWTVGHVESAVIPVTVKAGNKTGSQHMQGTVCYHHDGNRPGYTSKDMLGFSQKVVSDWAYI